MISKSKIALIAALAVSIASPAFAQSFNNSPGLTGGGAIGSNGVAVREHSHARIAATGTRGLYDYAAVPFTPRADVNSNSPALTGGGSTGYNQMLLNY
jgi:hypothetical protein